VAPLQELAAGAQEARLLLALLLLPALLVWQLASIKPSMALSLATSTLAFHGPALMTPRMNVVMQEPAPTFQDAGDVSKAAAVADKKGEFCYGLPGSLPPFENFDPFNLLDGKTFDQVRTWREAELAHCRVGMLAAAGFLVQEKFHPLFSGDGGPAIKQIPALPPAIWFLITLSIGVCEAYRVQVGWSNPNEPDHVFQKLRPTYVPGDIGWDPLGLKPEDPEEFKLMQTKELQNGRVAMIAAAGFMAQEAVTGDTWGTYWGAPDF